jgi:hypothetical protein
MALAPADKIGAQRYSLHLDTNFIAKGLFGLVRRLMLSDHLAPGRTTKVGSGSCDVHQYQRSTQQSVLNLCYMNGLRIKKPRFNT